MSLLPSALRKHFVFFASVIKIQMTAMLSNANSDVREPVDH